MAKYNGESYAAAPATCAPGCECYRRSHRIADDVDAPKRQVDLGVDLSKDWEWDVARAFVHAVNGRGGRSGVDALTVAVSNAEPGTAYAVRLRLGHVLDTVRQEPGLVRVARPMD